VRGALDAETEVQVDQANWTALKVRRDASEVLCPDNHASARIIDHIHRAKVEKDTVGGWVECHVFGAPVGLGSCAQWHTRLDARLAGAVMGIQAFKAVEIGLGKACAARVGSAVHDPIQFDPAQAHTAALGYTRPSNNAGGIEGGMTNGMPVVVRGTMKPISTLLRGMPSIDLNTKAPQHSDYERSDVSAIAAASVVMENVVGFEIARVFLEKFGGDTMREVEAAYRSFLDMARRLPHAPGSIASGEGETSES
jgi:chorismate synthase